MSQSEVFLDFDRENDSASNEPIFVEFRLDFDGLLSQKLSFGGFRKHFRCFLLSETSFQKV